MTKLLPEIPHEQVVEREEQLKISSDSYWKKFSEFYPKVFDGMEYTAYIASGHEPYVVMVKIKAFVDRHKTAFAVIGFIQLLVFLTRFLVW